MHKTEMDLRDICEMKEKLVSWMKEELEKGKDCVETAESGQVIDMIKDLSEVEKNCWKAAYYKTVTCAMLEAGDEDDGGMMGYDNWRYSSGRFAPTGRGHFAGYPNKNMVISGDKTRNPGTVYSADDNSEYGMRNIDDLKMGYPTPRMPTMHRSQTGNVITSRYGYPYDEWNEARRYYTETHSDSDKKMMDHKAIEHMTAAAESIKHIWKEADPELKEKLKKELQPVIDELEDSGM